mmetsp:Transcript_39206/g.91709  ORF Transcript_39206/g.91709 Transcript_39206/m.91709 type:complete len:239 (+) Transcript_39206:335-1051(+)
MRRLHRGGGAKIPPAAGASARRPVRRVPPAPRRRRHRSGEARARLHRRSDAEAQGPRALLDHRGRHLWRRILGRHTRAVRIVARGRETNAGGAAALPGALSPARRHRRRPRARVERHLRARDPHDAAQGQPAVAGRVGGLCSAARARRLRRLHRHAAFPRHRGRAGLRRHRRLPRPLPLCDAVGRPRARLARPGAHGPLPRQSALWPAAGPQLHRATRSVAADVPRAERRRADDVAAL